MELVQGQRRPSGPTSQNANVSGQSVGRASAKHGIQNAGVPLTEAADQRAMTELIPTKETTAAAAPVGKESREYFCDEHKMTIKDVAARFGTHVNERDISLSQGLTEDQAVRLLVSHGRNILTPPKTTPEWKKFLHHFAHPLLVLLEVASALGFLAYGLNKDPNNLILALALVVLVLITGIMNYVQERSAGSVMNSIQGMLPAQCRVIRAGREYLAPAVDLVPGDLVRLTIGSRVPADIRIVAASDFKVEMSSLTGESDAIECGPDKKSDMPAEARNIIFNSTLVMNGDCRGIVIKTGDDTMIGSIAGLAGSTKATQTTMEKEVLRVVYFISTLAVLTAFAFFGVGMGRNLGVVFSFVNAFILVLVANVPEGLPATVTSILNLTAKSLAQKNIFIKRTDLIETLGSATVIASDKTGTLTQNRMTVENMWIGMTYHRARGEIRRATSYVSLSVPPSRAASQASSPAGGFLVPHSPSTDPLAGMTIGRGMSFLSLDGGAPVAVIHNITGPPGPRGTRTMSEDLSALTVGRGGSTSLGRSTGGDTVGRQHSLVVLESTGLKQPAQTVRRSSLPGRGQRARPAPHLTAMFQEGGPSDEDEQEDETAAEQDQGKASTGPETSQSTSEQREAANTAALKGGRAAVRRSSSSRSTARSAGQARSGSTEDYRDATAEADAAAGPRPGQGAAGSDLVLTGFSGPLMDPAPTANLGLAKVAVLEPDEGDEGGPDRAANTSSGSHATVTGGSALSLGSGEAQGAVGAHDVTVAVRDWEKTPAKATATTLAKPGPMSPGGTIQPQGSFMQHVSFMSFRGFTKVLWGQANAFSRVCTIAAVCNRSSFSADGRGVGADADATAARADRSAPSRPFPPGIDSRTVLGDASEAALLRYVDGLAPIFEWRAAYPILFEIPFNSTNKWAYCVTKLPEDPSNYHLAFMKGAPERIIQRCTHHYHDGVEVPIDDAYLKHWAAAYERFGVMGERVLGFAYAKIPARDARVYKTDETAYPLQGLVFAGLVSLVDPPKPGTDEAVGVCKAAGIRVTMVTGDHPLTAEAIARKVGIVTLPTAREVAAARGVPEASIALSDPAVGAVVLPGYALPDLTEDDWAAVINKTEVVFARTSPQQKLQIVEAYQKAGHIVAVTGDGTNDSPALKKADIGVSMGSANASDVAREAADMVIMDDNFASIVHAITLGRVVFDNIKKTIAYTITHLWPELIPILAALIFDIPIMLSGLLILLVDCVTEQGPAISLTYEPAETSVMSRPPRNLKTDRMVDFPLLFYSYIVMGAAETLVCILAYLSVFIQAGVPLDLVAYHPNNWVDGAPDLSLPDGKILTGAQQVALYRTAVGAYFLNLVLCQGWHIWLTKTRRVSLFKHAGVRGNLTTAYGVLFAVIISIFVIYTPDVNAVFGDTRVPGLMWLPHFLFAMWAFAWTEAVKYGARREDAAGKRGWIIRWLAW